MIKEIIHDPIFLAVQSVPATDKDSQVAQDLIDTLKANREVCVGMAANMIGVRKCIIAFWDENKSKQDYTLMLNPTILQKEDPFETEEGCLSLLGNPRKCKRYRTIKVRYQMIDLQTRIQKYTGWTAQIIQHEIDHCNGILI